MQPPARRVTERRTANSQIRTLVACDDLAHAIAEAGVGGALANRDSRLAGANPCAGRPARHIHCEPRIRYYWIC